MALSSAKYSTLGQLLIHRQVAMFEIMEEEPALTCRNGSFILTAFFLFKIGGSFCIS